MRLQDLVGLDMLVGLMCLDVEGAVMRKERLQSGIEQTRKDR